MSNASTLDLCALAALPVVAAERQGADRHILAEAAYDLAEAMVAEHNRRALRYQAEAEAAREAEEARRRLEQIRELVEACKATDFDQAELLRALAGIEGAEAVITEVYGAEVGG